MSKSNALLKVDKVWGELVNLWQPHDSKLSRFSAFVDCCKKQQSAIFPSVDWDDHIWEISQYESTQSARQATHNSNVLFTQRNGSAKKVKVAIADQIPFPPPFLDLAKSFVVIRHLAQPVNHASHMVTIRAFRYLFEVFATNGLTHIHQLNGVHFDQAATLAIEHGETAQTLYRTGEHLSHIADKLAYYSLCTAFDWHNPFPRVESTGGSQQLPIATLTSVEQAEQLPKTAYLVHLAALWQHYDELEPGDKMTVCMGVLLMATGLRMDEFCGIHIGCIPERQAYEAQPMELTFSGRMSKVLRLSVLARKRFVWDEKMIPACLTDTVYLVIERMSDLSSDAREACHSLLVHKRWSMLDGFADLDMISAKELAGLFGYSKTSNLITQLERYGVFRDSSSTKKLTAYRIRDIHSGIANAYRQQIGDLVEGLGPNKHKIPLWNLLTLQFKFEHGKGGLPLFPIPLSGTQIQDAFRGRDYVGRLSGKQSRINSLFERYEFDGLKVAKGGVRTHQFRHLLNTVMQQSEEFSQEDIAKYFLRAGVRDNAAYDHSTPSSSIESTMSSIQAFAAKYEPGYQSQLHDVSRENATKFIRKFPLLSADELLSELDTLGSSHLMDIGRCRHDYTQDPCGQHYACLNNCQHYRRVKGHQPEVERIQQMMDRAERQIAAAQLDVDDGLVNAHVWLAHHQRFLQGCRTALAIEHDDRYKVGDVVAVFPHGRDSCEVH